MASVVVASRPPLLVLAETRPVPATAHLGIVIETLKAPDDEAAKDFTMPPLYVRLPAWPPLKPCPLTVICEPRVVRAGTETRADEAKAVETTDMARSVAAATENRPRLRREMTRLVAAKSLATAR